MQLKTLTPHLGAEVRGIDLASVTANDARSIRELLEEYLVLFFRDQSLTLAEYRQFGEAIGELERTPMVGKVSDEFDTVDIVEIPKGFPRGGYTDQWHSDVYLSGQPPYATTLRPEILPSIGGDTLWASMYAAYELLSAPLQRLADELEVELVRQDAVFVHPAVRVHPRTGRKALNVNSLFSRRIVGVSSVESTKLIDMFAALATLPEVQLRYSWTEDTIAMWDNGFTQHYAIADYGEPRRMQRMTIAGGPVQGVSDH